jgi:hypothetical protein
MRPSFNLAKRVSSPHVPLSWLTRRAGPQKAYNSSIHRFHYHQNHPSSLRSLRQMSEATDFRYIDIGGVSTKETRLIFLMIPF